MKLFPFCALTLLVLGQSGFVHAQETNGGNGQTSNAQLLFEESLELLKPLSDEQIKQFREFSKQQDEALSPAIPKLRTRMVQVTLEPGRQPITVHTTANTVTAIVFHDNTGSPWEITSLTNGSPTNFQILKPEIPDGNLINILPLKSNVSSNIVVTLKDKDIPMIIAIQSDNIKASARSGDSMVLVKLAHMGPKAVAPIVEKFDETVNSTMLSILDHVPPQEAKLLKLSSKVPNLKIWQYKKKLYIRTQDLLIFPSWLASVHGAGNIKCYEVTASHKRILLSVNGVIQTIDLE